MCIVYRQGGDLLYLDFQKSECLPTLGWTSQSLGRVRPEFRVYAYFPRDVSLNTCKYSPKPKHTETHMNRRKLNLFGACLGGCVCSVYGTLTGRSEFLNAGRGRVSIWTVVERTTLGI